MHKTMLAILGCLLSLQVVPTLAADASEPQVLAKMADTVITVQDFLSFAPVLQGLAKQTGAEAAKHQLLEGLIGQELFARQAVRLGLDQSSGMQFKLKHARNNLLAQEYIQWQAAQGVAVGDDEIEQYFEAHRDEFQGKQLQEAAPEVKAKLTSAMISNLLAKTKAELRQQEGVLIDEKLLRELQVGTTAP